MQTTLSDTRAKLTRAHTVCLALTCTLAHKGFCLLF